MVGVHQTPEQTLGFFLCLGGYPDLVCPGTSVLPSVVGVFDHQNVRFVERKALRESFVDPEVVIMHGAPVRGCEMVSSHSYYSVLCLFFVCAFCSVRRNNQASE